MDGIFISYRRDDSAGYSGRLYDRLVAHFGAKRVFMDVEGIEPGVDFVKAIEAAVASCRVLIVMIGDEWLQTVAATGRRRLDDPNDFVRLETGAALKRDIRVVPVLVGGALMPRAEELPAELQALTRRQAVEINHKQWDASSSELIRTLEKILDNGSTPAPGQARVGTPAAARPTTASTSARPAWLWPAGAVAAAALSGLWLAWPSKPLPEIAQGVPLTKAKPVAATPTAVEAAAKPPLPSSSSVKGEVARPGAPALPAATPAPAPTAATPAPPPPVAVAAPTPAAKPPPTPPAVAASAPAPAAKPPTAVAAPVSAAAVVKPAPVPASATQAAKAEAAVTEVAPALTAPAAPPAAVAVAPPTASPATLPPTAAGKPSTSALGGLPRQGESWTYRSAGKWPTSPKRNFQIIVQSVAGEVVTETLRMIDPAGGGEVSRSRGGKAEFVAWKDIGIEFSPYLGALGELARLESQSGLATPDWESQWTLWYSQFKRIGQESVSVPAGNFNAHKFEVWSNRHATGTRMMAPSEPTRVHYYVWYAPEVKRYVKMQRRVISATNNELEAETFELVARTP